MTLKHADCVRKNETEHYDKQSEEFFHLLFRFPDLEAITESVE